MTQLAPDFREFLSTLIANDVEYLLIGGYAIGCYGKPRATEDIDFWVGTDSDNATRVFKALEEFGVGPNHETLKILQEEDKIVRIGYAPFRVEMLTTISGVDFEDCYKRKQSHEVDGMLIDVISLDDLKKNKKASGRPKDIADLEVLP